MMGEGLLVAHAAATWFMVGLIWFVQVVHYPLFAGVGETGFAAYEARHQRLTTFVVLPPMLVELVSALAIAVLLPAGVSRPLALVGVGLVGLIWASTFLLQVPCHAKLARASTRALTVCSCARTSCEPSCGAHEAVSLWPSSRDEAAALSPRALARKLTALFGMGGMA